MDKDLIYLKNYFEAGIENNADIDYVWLFEKYLPILEKAKGRIHTKEGERILSESFYFLGDVYDFIDAPISSLKAYEACLRYNEDNPCAYRELGNKYVQLGNFKKGTYLLELAFLLNPSDTFVNSDIDSAYEDWRDDIILYSEDNLGWRIIEYLLSKNVKKAKSLIKKLDIKIKWRFEAYLFSVENNIENYLKSWESIIVHDFSIELTYADFFFIPDVAWNDRRLWESILLLGERVGPGVFPTPASLSLSSRIKNAQDLVRTFCCFQIARIDRNVSRLKQLQKDFPEWLELNDYIKMK